MEQTNNSAPAWVADAISRPLAPSLVRIMAITAGMTVANLYYLQPLLAIIGREFGVTAGAAGFVATLAQLGYALGMLLIVPLGDVRERRGLIIATLVAVTIALLATAAAPSLGWLALGSLAVGMTTVAPQLIVPLAATLASPQQRGRVVGMVMSGLLIGILLARTVSGVVGAHFGWRAMFVIAGGAMIVLALILWRLLPISRPSTALSYPQLLRSLPGLLRSQPVLRETCALGALAFAAFSVFWVALAFFLETPPYHYGSEVAGLFGLVGVAGALAAALVGRIADRRDARLVTGATMLLVLVAYALFWLVGWSLLGLAAGVVLLDLGVQGTQVSNQARIYALQPEARSRVNTIYMTIYFIGGSLGSLIGAYSWSHWGWNGVCAAGGLLIGVALAIYAASLARRGAGGMS